MAATRHERLLAARLLLLLTICLGALFLLLENAYTPLPTFGAKMYFTAFFFMTGLHALHVLGGSLALAVILVRHLQGAYDAERHVPVECVAMFWHFIDVVWVFLWSCLYLARWTMRERTVPIPIYVAGYGVALLAATGAWLLAIGVRGNEMLTLALVLACVQAGVVILCFMDLAVQPASNRLAIVGAAVMVALLVFLTALDPLTRQLHASAPEPSASLRQPAPRSP